MSAPDRLPERLRRCVDQTIAAEALEGWRPTAEHVEALVALLNDEITFGDYLAGYRARYPAQPTAGTAPRLRRRSKPYLIPGTTLLRNNFGADSHAMLADLEYVSTAGRIAGWHRRLAEGDVGVDDLDVRSIHKQLFADVYEWAGCYRVTELRLGDDVFARQSSVHQMMERSRKPPVAWPPTIPNTTPRWPTNSPGFTPTTTAFTRFAKATGEPAR